MPAKIARLATRPPFWIPEVSVAVRSSRPSCSKAEKREYSWQIGGHPGNPFNVRHFLVVAHCERLLKTAFCADECFVLQIKSAVGSFEQLEPQFTAAFAAPRRWRRLSHGSHGIS